MNKSRTATAMYTTILSLGGLTACGDSDTLSGSERDRASKAALAETGGGRVTDSGTRDADDTNDHAYEIEVTLDNGDEVDVDLDKDFKVVRTDTDRND